MAMTTTGFPMSTLPGVRDAGDVEKFRRLMSRARMRMAVHGSIMDDSQEKAASMKPADEAGRRRRRKGLVK